VAVALLATERMLEHGAHLELAYQLFVRLICTTLDRDNRRILECRAAFLRRRGWEVDLTRRAFLGGNPSVPEIAVRLVDRAGAGVEIVSPSEHVAEIECLAVVERRPAHTLPNPIV
jgi:hypothetical protein